MRCQNIDKSFHKVDRGRKFSCTWTNGLQKRLPGAILLRSCGKPRRSPFAKPVLSEGAGLRVTGARCAWKAAPVPAATCSGGTGRSVMERDQGESVFPAVMQFFSELSNEGRPQEAESERTTPALIVHRLLCSGRLLGRTESLTASE